MRRIGEYAHGKVHRQAFRSCLYRESTFPTNKLMVETFTNAMENAGFRTGCENAQIKAKTESSALKAQILFDDKHCTQNISCAHHDWRTMYVQSWLLREDLRTVTCIPSKLSERHELIQSSVGAALLLAAAPSLLSRLELTSSWTSRGSKETST